MNKQQVWFCISDIADEEIAQELRYQLADSDALSEFLDTGSVYVRNFYEDHEGSQNMNPPLTESPEETLDRYWDQHKSFPIILECIELFGHSKSRRLFDVIFALGRISALREFAIQLDQLDKQTKNERTN